jgi:hypothetical protein
MNLNKSELIKTIMDLGFPDKDVVLPLDTFYEGNEDSSSVGVSIYPSQPSPKVFYETFKKLLDTKMADKIFVRVTDIDDPKDWFYTDTIYIIGDLTIDQLSAAIVHLQFDEIFIGWMCGKPVNAGEYDGTKNVFSVWWD